ncbi:MAG: ABC transporter permease [Verrucomicrobiales bacterium]
MLPFSYATRNLLRDKARLLQTVGGSALVVLLVMAALAINQGMKQVLAASGSPNNVILLGAGSEESVQRSEVAEQAAGIAASEIPGVAETMGTRAVSTEIHYMGLAAFPDGSEEQSLFRGVTPQALLTHPEVQVIDGTFPRTGEIMVGRLAWRQLHQPKNQLTPGAKLSLEGQELTISGVFAAPGTVMESEIWIPIGDLRVLAQRESVSCVVLRLENPDDFAEADLFAKRRLDLELSAIRESSYYARLSSFFGPLRAMTWLTAGLIAAGALFGGLNTLYAAFASRIRELATLQAIGFRRRTILASLIQESTLASLTGTLLASIAALLLLDGLVVPFSIGTFSLTIGPEVAFIGILTGLFLGFIGSLPPAIRCLKPPLPVALRSS